MICRETHEIKTIGLVGIGIYRVQRDTSPSGGLQGFERAVFPCLLRTLDPSLK